MKQQENSSLEDKEFIKLVEDKTSELVNDSTELYAFVSENSPELDETELDALVNDLEGSYLEIENYVVAVLENN